MTEPDTTELVDDWEPLSNADDQLIGPKALYLRVTPYDQPQRRALWVRFVHAHKPYAYEFASADVPRVVELRAGREGDDIRLSLREGDVLTAKTLDKLVDVLLTMRWGLSDLYDLTEKTWGSR